MHCVSFRRFSKRRGLKIGHRFPSILACSVKRALPSLELTPWRAFSTLLLCCQLCVFLFFNVHFQSPSSWRCVHNVGNLTPRFHYPSAILGHAIVVKKLSTCLWRFSRLPTFFCLPINSVLRAINNILLRFYITAVLFYYLATSISLLPCFRYPRHAPPAAMR